MRALFLCLLAVTLLAAAPDGVAQGARPVVIVVPFSGGGPTDTVARILAPALARELGAPVTVENTSGGGGTVGTARAAKGAADGSVLLLHHLGHVTAPALYAKLGFDPLTDFVAIGRVADVPMTLVARSNLPPKDAKELLGWIRSQGRKLNLGHAGIGAASHLCGLLLMRALGTPLNEVAYKGTAPAMTDLLSGQLDLMCDQTTNTLPQVRNGRIKVYAVTTAARLPTLKDVPTLTEAGLKGFEVTVWHGLYAPRGTPADSVARTAKALQAALRDSSVMQRLCRARRCTGARRGRDTRRAAGVDQGRERALDPGHQGRRRAAGAVRMRAVCALLAACLAGAGSVWAQGCERARHDRAAHARLHRYATARRARACSERVLPAPGGQAGRLPLQPARQLSRPAARVPDHELPGRVSVGRLHARDRGATSRSSQPPYPAPSTRAAAAVLKRGEQARARGRPGAQAAARAPRATARR